MTSAAGFIALVVVGGGGGRVSVRYISLCGVPFLLVVSGWMNGWIVSSLGGRKGVVGVSVAVLRG